MPTGYYQSARGPAANRLPTGQGLPECAYLKVLSNRHLVIVKGATEIGHSPAAWAQGQYVRRGVTRVLGATCSTNVGTYFGRSARVDSRNYQRWCDYKLED